MTKYLISFNDGAMTFPEKELTDVADAARVVREEAKAAGVWCSAAGWNTRCRASWLPTERPPTALTQRTKERLGGFAVVDVASREEALEWAAKIAAACRCAHEVSELLPDPGCLIEGNPPR